MMQRTLVAGFERGRRCRLCARVAYARAFDMKIEATHARCDYDRRAVEEQRLRTRCGVELKRGGAIDRDEARQHGRGRRFEGRMRQWRCRHGRLRCGPHSRRRALGWLGQKRWGRDQRMRVAVWPRYSRREQLVYELAVALAHVASEAKLIAIGEVHRLLLVRLPRQRNVVERSPVDEGTLPLADECERELAGFADAYLGVLAVHTRLCGVGVYELQSACRRAPNAKDGTRDRWQLNSFVDDQLVAAQRHDASRGERILGLVLGELA